MLRVASRALLRRTGSRNFCAAAAPEQTSSLRQRLSSFCAGAAFVAFGGATFLWREVKAQGDATRNLLVQLDADYQRELTNLHERISRLEG